MPFDKKFNDIYTFGIKGAAEDVGAYAERLDEQIFTEGMLDRVYNQINKADVVVADMTGRNPNVFYEVGYAHALGKIVLLLTQNADDIPFDLKQYQHTIYNDIDTLKAKLASKIAWGINESKNRLAGVMGDKFEVKIDDVEIPEGSLHYNTSLIHISANATLRIFTIIVRNGGIDISPNISHIYLFSKWETVFTFYRLSGSGHRHLDFIKAHASDAEDGLYKQHLIHKEIARLPHGTSETFKFSISTRDDTVEMGLEESIRLRLHTASSYHDYTFKFKIKETSESSNPEQ
ncbi:MAG: hypothetical protein QOD28_2304 [Acidobacteriota bacterium]|nr:hypothetical protein [Acidobacteriota bacterium]